MSPPRNGVANWKSDSTRTMRMSPNRQSASGDSLRSHEIVTSGSGTPCENADDVPVDRGPARGGRGAFLHGAPARPLPRCLRELVVDEDHPSAVDDPEQDQEEDRQHQRELGQRLAPRSPLSTPQDADHVWVTVTLEFAGMQSPGIDGGFVLWVMTVLLVEPEEGANGPVKPAAVHFSRAALTVKPSRVGTRRHVGGRRRRRSRRRRRTGVGVGGPGAGVGVGDGVGTTVGAGLGVIAPELIVMPDEHGHQVPDWRL